ncbi:ArsR family transcriptional regulator [Streptomyces sp. WAC05374]|uniref:ArsR/SmtB family transcription factor n=1 Tax=Streptomyces sp. WAC05374 TaxID=2487420 RepID=UPI000F8952D0|nr:winged helix-turn-helix domain-containing protein [Streptomyces sp. WAC05374]RST18183.1 ArsR family transcriptional regulator [Streptomyces sp. WAC05374]TDF43758.1 ArsR family transcriptional regulator [Streptomyces sp. WAC05374]TDF52073.1 ArsR family transcriptional regulator [Streptomyces sp. WAC05374]TDF54429.1 ArsR family transcriptional regulator [Streptomyces sp. WAC05374]
MQRIHFDAADFARTRLRPTVGPLVETAFAAGLLSRSVGAPYARWRGQVTKRLPRWSSPPGHGGGVPDPEALIEQAERYGEDAGAVDRPSELPDVWQAAVAPYWDQLRAYLEAECEARGRIVMAGGVEQLLATLHPRMIWRSPVLEIPGGPDEDIHLDGRGLVLVPSVFLNHRPGRLMAATAENGQAVLAFAAPPDPARAAALWEEPDGREQSLGALVGQTRAAALRVLRATCTTSQLADQLGISAAGASQHTAVLRETGLITTRRIRNTVLHTVTPLGVALLDGRVVRSVSPQNAVRQRTRSALESVPQQRRAS